MYENEETAIVIARAVAGGAEMPSDRMLWAIQNVWDAKNGNSDLDIHRAGCDLIDAIEDLIAPFCEGEWENETTIAFDIVLGGYNRHQNYLNAIAQRRESLDEIVDEIATMLD